MMWHLASLMARDPGPREPDLSPTRVPPWLATLARSDRP